MIRRCETGNRDEEIDALYKAVNDHTLTLETMTSVLENLDARIAALETPPEAQPEEPV